ncbi:hypothetical protein EMIHUDRAFT_448194 [Emiliania huxleyi CCMP1516]|uniref:Uncharacterized protein n=2 Tax=Emiliania huxleyi TaxID=2903 RepID=A0A0D3IU05_EMIH1|nr:hypothetical protein EMIHUDRAFT_448194 [Emiliania huxleyi CCMP1516]EOD14740.1 hypothetical protein EMIHUDRAFT_448194 [Emiliania huxleyi CCMP1516]|eukprot:XP_005767169.1 hypothetical protein EMIHUDRAFT_448194 [Emiliania huxleyi CCMP1516]
MPFAWRTLAPWAPRALAPLMASAWGTGALAAVGGVGLAGFGAADDVCLADFGTVGATGFGAADGVGLADFGTVGATGFGAADGVGLGLGSLELLAPPEVCAAGCSGALAVVGGVGLAGFGAADGVCLADFGTVGATGFGAADGVGLGLGSLELLACAAGVVLKLSLHSLLNIVYKSRIWQESHIRMLGRSTVIYLDVYRIRLASGRDFSLFRLYQKIIAPHLSKRVTHAILL